jgi:hypothetical protein
MPTKKHSRGDRKSPERRAAPEKPQKNGETSPVRHAEQTEPEQSLPDRELDDYREEE